MNLRHYFTMDLQLTCPTSFPSSSAAARHRCSKASRCCATSWLTDEAFAAESHCYTIINTNSPRQIDIPMAQGLIDFARHGQMSIITPFTLMGAMALITVEAAMTLSHAEALADHPDTADAARRAGLLRHLHLECRHEVGGPGLRHAGTFPRLACGRPAGPADRPPWRCASGSAANINDLQAANETQFALWGCLMAGATVVIHAAGWLEGADRLLRKAGDRHGGPADGGRDVPSGQPRQPRDQPWCAGRGGAGRAFLCRTAHHGPLPDRIL